MPGTRRRGLLRTLLALAPAVAGCALRPVPVPVDPEATVAAHQEGRTLVVDRLPDGGRVGTVRPASVVRLPGRPDFVVGTDGETLGGLWVVAPATVVARRGTGTEDAPVGKIEPTWQDDVIRLTIAPADGPPLRSDPFRREGGGTGRLVLARTAETNLDLRGTYKAVVRDPDGVAVGWLRLRMSPYQPAARIYDAVLPPAVDPALGIASFVAVGSEIDWIEAHAIDVYRGGGPDGLERSIPIPR